MAVPSGLDDFVQLLRSDVQRAGAINWRTLCRNAQSHVASILELAEWTPEIGEACENAVARCCDYAGEIEDRGLLFSPEDAASKQARKLALMAIDELAARLDGARPSQRAPILAIPWG